VLKLKSKFNDFIKKRKASRFYIKGLSLVKVIFFFLVFGSWSCKKNKTSDGTVLVDPTIYSKSVYQPGTTVYGKNNYVKIIVGDDRCPVILSSPHDGTLLPTSMPERDHPDATIVRDLFVSDLTLKIATAFFEKTGMHPHIIINDIARSRMEPNRSLKEAYHKSEEANNAWREYQNFIKIARQIVIKNVGKGLYIDMHGHAHTKPRIEVGYIVSKSNLNADDAILDKLASSSSIYAIAQNSMYSFSNLIRGDDAFGTLLANEGLPAVPSKQDPKPNTDDYFNGGYCTYTYGSVNGGVISSLQLETNGAGLRNTPDQRTTSGVKIATAIISYLKAHF
jgi:hypothetical protein